MKYHPGYPLLKYGGGERTVLSGNPIFKCEPLVSGKVENKKTKTFEDSVKTKKDVNVWGVLVETCVHSG